MKSFSPGTRPGLPSVKAEKADCFESLATFQEPEYLWIGCSDSCVPAKVFVHRNVANLIHPTDLNMVSVVEYAANQLGVKYIIVRGQYGCGIRDAVSGQSFGLIDHWLQLIRDLARSMFNCRECWSEPDLDRLCEASVVAQAERLAPTPTLQAA